MCHVTHYNIYMIKSFADKDTERLFCDGAPGRFPSSIVARAIRKLDMVDSAYRVQDLRVPQGNRLHALKGDREGQYAVSVNDQWCICFRFAGEDAFDVEICDYY